MSNDKPVDEIPLTIEDITAGTKFERIVILESVNDIYNGKAVKIHSLTGRVFKELMHKFNNKSLEHPTVSFDMAIEACKKGIVDPDLAGRVEDMDEDVITQLGCEIIAASRPKSEEAIENFSNQAKGSSST